MSHQVDGPGRVLMPQVDHQDKRGAVEIINIDFLALCVPDDEAYARRGSNWAAVFVSKAAHAGSHRLLLHQQLIAVPVVSGRVVHDTGLKVDGLNGGERGIQRGMCW